MKRSHFALGLLLLLACSIPPATAQEPSAVKIVVPSEPVKAGEPVFVYLDGLASGQDAAFCPEPYLTVGPPHLVDRHGLFFTKTKGEHVLRAVAVSIVTIDGQAVPRVVFLRETIQVGEPEPGPDPPNPGPTPGGPWQVAIFHESDNRDNMSSDQLELLVGLGFRDEIEADGHRWVASFDVDELGPSGVVPARVRPFFQAAKDHAKPCVALAPVDGGAIQCYPLPKDAAAFKRLLGKP